MLLADVGVVFRGVVELARRAVAADFFVGVFVGALRHVFERDVGEAGQQVVARGGGLGFFPARVLDGLLGGGDVGHQAGGERFVLRGLGLADLFRLGVAGRFSLLLAQDGGADLFVEGHDLRHLGVAVHGRPARQGGGVGGRVLTDGADIVHVCPLGQALGGLSGV